MVKCAGVPGPRPRHVRAAGPPRRHPVSRRPPDPALRRRRLHPGVPDGDRVRPAPRRLRRPVRGDPGSRRLPQRRRRRRRRRRRLLPRREGQRRIPGRQPAPEGERGGPALRPRPSWRASPTRPARSTSRARRRRSRSWRRSPPRSAPRSGGAPPPRPRVGPPQARPHRPLGPLRRLDALGVDPLDPRAVRVPLPARLRPRARRRGVAREFDVIILVDGAYNPRGGADAGGGGDRPDEAGAARGREAGPDDRPANDPYRTSAAASPRRRPCRN